jgi:hypothetical protein
MRGARVARYSSISTSTPRVAMEVLRHTDFDLAMEIYAQVSSQATRDALKRLGESLDG